MRRATGRILATVVLAAVGLIGCGRSAGTGKVDPEPFRTAIHRYLDEHQMGLRVAAFKDLTVADGTAAAVVSLEHAEGMVGAKVRWTFTFRQQNGRWVAVSHAEKR